MDKELLEKQQDYMHLWCQTKWRTRLRGRDIKAFKQCHLRMFLSMLLYDVCLYDDWFFLLMINWLMFMLYDLNKEIRIDSLYDDFIKLTAFMSFYHLIQKTMYFSVAQVIFVKDSLLDVTKWPWATHTRSVC